jgi:hypothetical protein
MTDAAAPLPTAVDRWLSEQRKTVDNDIAQFLDVDGGLREVLIHARHADLVEDLNHRLDVEAGLAAILPTAAGARVTDPQDTPTAPATDGVELRMCLAAVPPQTRLALRNHPVVTLSVLADLHCRACELALDPRLDRTRDLDLALDRAVGLDLDRALDPRLDLSRALDRALARALASALGLDLDLDLARNLGLGRDRARDLGLDLDFARDLDLGRDRDRAVALALAPALALAFVHALDRASAFFGGQDFGLNRARARARDLAVDLARTLGLDSARARDLARVRVRVPDRARTRDLARDLARGLDEVLGTFLGLAGAVGFGSALLDGLLDDFTGADLSTVELTGVDLVGVRWSLRGTRWPAELDVEQLRNHSRETKPGSEVYVVRRGVETAEPSRV